MRVVVACTGVPARPVRRRGVPRAAADTGAETAGAAAEKLRASVEEVGVTVSIGWAAWEGEGPDVLLQRADDALYAAKAGGRDCVVAAPATLPRRNDRDHR